IRDFHVTGVQTCALPIYIFVTLIIIVRMEKYNAYSFLLERTARRIKQYAQYQFNCQQFGITVDQWTILKNLNQYADLSQKELAEIGRASCRDREMIWLVP